MRGANCGPWLLHTSDGNPCRSLRLSGHNRWFILNISLFFVLHKISFPALTQSATTSAYFLTRLVAIFPCLARLPKRNDAFV